MKSFLFSANSTTDEISITAHGLLTGDGPCAVRSDGSLPVGLIPTTSYWVIRVDANTIKLASSNALALAGTAINLTSNGSAGQILEIGIPFRIATIYVPSSQVRSADLVSIQRALVALHGLLTGQSQDVWRGIDLSHQSYLERRPLQIFRQSSLPRSIVDSLGYRQGQVTEFEELWRNNGINTFSPGWNFFVGPTGVGHTDSSAVIEDPSDSFNQRRLRINLPNTALPLSEYTLWHNHLGWMDNNSSITFEQSISFVSVGSGTNLDIGLQFDNLTTNNRFVVFEFLNAGPTVRGKIVGASSSFVSIATSIASNVPHTLKIEILGSSITGLTDGTFTARFIYNGSNVQTITFTNPGASQFRPYVKSYSLNNANGDAGILLGRMRVCFNHRLSGEI